jgi:hypothetical protein
MTVPGKWKAFDATGLDATNLEATDLDVIGVALDPKFALDQPVAGASPISD